jgi:hypothetical protein
LAFAFVCSWPKALDVFFQVGGGRSKKECFEAFRDYCQQLKARKAARDLRLADRGHLEPAPGGGGRRGEGGAATPGAEDAAPRPQGSASPVVAAPGDAAPAVYLGAHHAQHVRRSEQFAPPPGVSTSIEVENIEEFGSMERR